MTTTTKLDVIINTLFYTLLGLFFLVSLYGCYSDMKNKRIMNDYYHYKVLISEYHINGDMESLYKAADLIEGYEQVKGINLVEYGVKKEGRK